MSAHEKKTPAMKHAPPVSFPEVDNPAFASALHPKTRLHPFEGDEHGHDRHDTIPAEEESAEDELRPSVEHNPAHPKE